MNKKDIRFYVPDNQSTAMVMFCDSQSLWFLRFLKTGYRHCFIAVKSNKDWVIYEPLLSRTEISIIKDADAHYVRSCFEQLGCSVLAVALNRTHPVKKSLLAPFTCVRAVARVLGVPSWGILTPYQLYKYLAQL